MCTKNKLDRILSKMLETYRSVYGENVIKVVLYGSYSRGDYGMDSDIDIVAIVEGERESIQSKLKDVWEVSCDLELEYGVIVSPTVIPRSEYEMYKNILPYYRNIDREGIEINA